MPPDLIRQVVTGERSEFYLRITPRWISLLVETVDMDDGHWRSSTKDEATRLSWPENRGSLQCGLQIGHHRLRSFSVVRLTFCDVTLTMAVKDIDIETTPDGRYDVFAIQVVRLTEEDNV